MAAHDLVEGSYGVAKSLAVLNWGRQFHHLVGVAREALIASLVVMAYNFHIIRTWQRRQDLAAGVATAPMFDPKVLVDALIARSEEHTSELQSLMRISYAVFCLKKKKNKT